MTPQGMEEYKRLLQKFRQENGRLPSPSEMGDIGREAQAAANQAQIDNMSPADTEWQEWRMKYYRENGTFPPAEVSQAYKDDLRQKYADGLLTEQGVTTPDMAARNSAIAAAENAANTRTMFDQGAVDAQGRESAQLYTDAQAAEQAGYAGSQRDLVALLADQAQGYMTAPSVAEAQLKMGADQAVNQVDSGLASQRGLNPALAARLGANQSASIMQNTNQQAAVLRAQEYQQNLQRQLENQRMQAGITQASQGQLSGDAARQLQSETGQRALNDNYANAMRATGDRRVNDIMGAAQGYQGARTGESESEYNARAQEARTKADMFNKFNAAASQATSDTIGAVATAAGS